MKWQKRAKSLIFPLLKKSLDRRPKKTSESTAIFHCCTTLIVSAFWATFYLWERRMGKPSSDKSEKAQCIRSLWALQNGRFALSEISCGTKWLLVQDRSERRLLWNPSQQTFIKICEIQVVRQPLRVSLPLFWFRASSKSSYQITSNPYCYFEAKTLK